MSDSSHKALLKILRLLYKPHPWHGISIGKHMPDRVRAFIEIVPTDTVKYELDKTTGYLKVDRPLKYSSVYPTLYGFIPQTVCDEESAALCARRTRRRRVVGDGDPLDICILSEKDFTHGDIVLDAVPIGGLRMLDGNQADDKIIAVLVGDAVYGGWRDIRQSPPMLVERLKHHFLTYKQPPDVHKANVRITHVYGRKEAHQVIRLGHTDYQKRFVGLKELFTAASHE